MDRAAAFFSNYDAFGPRRAASEGDLASSQWLAAQCASIAPIAARVEVGFQRFMPGEAYLSVGGEWVDGLPLFDAGLTLSDGVMGAIGPLGSDAPIGFARMSPAMASLPGNAFSQERASTRHQAIVIALTTREGGLAPLNAHDLDRPYGPPVLQIAGRDADRVDRLIALGAQVRVVVLGRREPAVSHNVRVELPGERPELLLLTPRTSWWTSTAERAGGIWAWVESLRALAALPERRCRVVALATCGHELGHIGAHQAFAQEPELANRSALVIHLGANLGAAVEPALTVRSNVPGLADRMAVLLVAAGYPSDAIAAVTGGKAGGEAHEIEQRGGRYLSLIGSNPWFHAPEDRWPASITLEHATAISRAVSAMAVQQAG